MNFGKKSLFYNMFLILSSSILFLFWNINQEIMFFLTASYILFFLSFIIKFDIKKPFLFGFLIAVTYLSFFKQYYHYNTMNLTIFTFPVFPLIAWPLGLTLVYYCVTFFNSLFKIKSIFAKILVGYIIYVPSLIFIEYLGYHYSNIQLRSAYAGLSVIDCMHIPWSLKIVYFLNGLLFMILMFFFNGRESLK